MPLRNGIVNFGYEIKEVIQGPNFKLLLTAPVLNFTLKNKKQKDLCDEGDGLVGTVICSQ